MKFTSGNIEINGETIHILREETLPKTEFLSAAKASTIVTPDAALATAARDSGHSVISVQPPDSKMIAEFGWKKLQAGETTTPERLEANYMRRSDAEIFVKKTS